MILVHPRHGTREPATGSPPRLARSARRTSALDMLRPSGPQGALVVVGTARDAVTDDDATLRTCETLSLAATIDFSGGRVLASLASAPAEPALQALVGQRVSSGFRRAVDECVPHHRDGSTLLYLLLDDLPVASLVSGYAVMAAETSPHTRLPQKITPDICAGWRTGGTIMLELQDDQRVPFGTGPFAPSLVRADDTEGWHDLPALALGGVRRARRLDVTLVDGVVVADSHYRDSYMGDDGEETVIHEYAVFARIDPVTHTVIEANAVPKVLPWMECPAAAASAARLAGLSLAELRPIVRDEFVGVTTCTHLNDQMRSLADIPTLLRLRDSDREQSE